MLIITTVAASLANMHCGFKNLNPLDFQITLHKSNPMSIIKKILGTKNYRLIFTVLRDVLKI